MKTSLVRRNCDLEGLLESQDCALHAVYNRIGTLGNGFFAVIALLKLRMEPECAYPH